ncbi:transcription initiation factor TFIID subunit 5-like [Branchiostoma lanceolatum]|uniref:transcription initiation factor TFIID subunit 5-like n=1 Tax=Branchiostoma lanceolatum TaxID=7740 RepID=UPI0034555546
MADPNRTVVVTDGSNDASTVSGAATGVQSSPKGEKGAGTDPSKMDQQTLAAVLQFLKNNKLKDAEAALRREAKLPDGNGDSSGSSRVATSGEVSSVLSAYESEGDLARYCEYYNSLSSFIESSLDAHKHELGCLLYPVFIHMYLQLVYNRHEKEAHKFFNRFSVEQEDWHQEDLRTLSTVKTREQMEGNDLMDTFRSSKFVLRMSRDSYQSLRRYLKQNEHRELLSILQDHLFIDVFDGVPRNREQVQATSGAMMGEARRDANKVKVLYGLPKEPDINVPLDDDDEGAEGEDKPKKKKQKKDLLLNKNKKADPNAPPPSRIPLPELKDADKLEKVLSWKEGLKRVPLGRENLPSICFYTLANAYQNVSAVGVSEDSSLLAAGFEDSNVRVWSLSPQRLRTMRNASELDQLDKEADDIVERMMDEKTAADSWLLHGHTGPVYATSFSPDREQLLTSSEDGTVRLWSLHTYSNLVVYKGHNYPVWDVQFSPTGYYFVSGGHDRVARLWGTDQFQPIRMFVGHYSDVTCIQYHPNSNYVATGSSDRTVRLWDVLNGNCVRVMTGHKAAVHTLAWSPDGRYLASAGVDKNVLLWDIAYGRLLAEMKGHTDPIYSLCFSREGSILASGGIDNTVKIWDVQKVFEEIAGSDDLTSLDRASLVEVGSLLLGSFQTKATPVLKLHFSHRNLLLGCGRYQHS